MNLMLRTVGGKPTPAPEEKRRHDREVVQKILAENEKFRTRMGFFDSNEPKPDQIKDIPKFLHIYPDEIIFKDITENQTYEINVIVRNLTKAVKRIRIMQPTTSKFRCDYDMAGLLAPGLSIELVVSFSTSVPGQFHDRIIILSDMDYKFEIPLHAYSPMANIIFEPFINMGFIPVNQEKRLKVRFKNEGSLEGAVELRFTDLPDFKIEPKANFRIKPNGATHEVDFVYFPREAGIFRGIVEVYQEGQSFMNHIDVNATSVEFLKFVVDTDGNELSKVDFGNVFFGQKKELRGYLVNNSPKPFKFKVSFIHGLHNNYDEKNNLKTPAEEGHQQTQRVMTILPSEGTIDSYSQLPITFYCNSKVQEDHLIWVRNNCFKKTKAEPKFVQQNKIKKQEEISDIDDKCKKNHEYTAMFNFEGQSDSKLLMMTATCICPRVSFGEESHFDFGTIKANESKLKSIDVSNMHTNMDVVIDFPNVSVFYVEPSRIHLKAGEKTTIKVYFRPRSLGKFIRKVDFIINGNFLVAVTLVGIASEIGLKQKKLTGPLQVDFDTYDEKTYMEKLNREAENQNGERVDSEGLGPLKGVKSNQKGRSRTAYPFKPNPKLMKVADTTQESEIPLIPTANQNLETYDQYQMQKFNSKVANDYLTQQRMDREMMKKRGYIVGQTTMRNDRIKSYVGKASQGTAENFMTTNIGTDRLESPKMNIPFESDTLFVMNPISTYEPYSMYDFSANFSPDYVNPNVYPEKPESHAEARDVNSELTGEELQKLQVGPTKIDFGSIFLKSTETKYFQIKNDLRKPIMARLDIEGYNELQDSYQKPQIIPSGKTASFKVCFSSQGQQLFENMVTYTINEKQNFRIFVRAQVTQVLLRLSKSEEEFIFEDEQVEMKLSREIQIINDGNDQANFEWRESKSGCFVVKPPSGNVPPRSSRAVKVEYTPSGTKQVEEDELLMTVVDGPYRTLSCKAVLSEVKYEFTNKNIDFGTMSVRDRKVQTTYLKNELSKASLVFQVDLTTLPQGLEIHPLNDRILPGGSARFDLFYCTAKDTPLKNHEVKLNIRGDAPASLLVSANPITPQVRILEEEFNFGEVTFGNTETLVMTLVNESEIDITLTLDLREQDNIKESELYSRLDVRYLGENEGEDDQVLEEKDIEDVAKTEFTALKDIKQDNMADESLEEEANQKDNQQAEGSRFFTIRLKKKKTYQFELKFSPKPGHRASYSFNLPITLAGFEMPNLKRRIICTGIHPKLTMEPMNGEVIFDKKIITSLDAVVPQPAIITFTNSQLKPISFRIDTSAIEKKEVFSIIPVTGTIDPQVPVTVKVSFKPQGNEKYTVELPLYIEDDVKPYTVIKLRGEGAYPKLLFDRREVIMPIVPLGIESKCSFRIDNEGYQNLLLKHYLAQDIGAINLSVKPETKNMGSGTNSIRVDCSFINNKPISFTTKLIFEDEAKQIYPIFVSGTTDNCLLTTYPFFLVNGEDYKPTAEPNKPIKLEVTEADMDSQLSPLNENNDTSKAGSPGSKSAKSSLGFTPIKMSDLERACKFCKDWLNNFVLSIEIDNFPNNVIESNGKEIYELISFLTKRNPPQMHKFEPGLKKQQRVEQICNQYSELLRYLKEAGAMLNTIRPEFLLSQSDLNTYYKKNYNPYALPSANRVSAQQFKYMSLEAWSTLFYQILKVYYECRVSVKLFKAMKELPTDKPLLTEINLEPNQIYSQAELILLRWLELAVEKKFPAVSKARHINYDTDLKTGLGIGSLIQMYIDSPIRKVMSLRPMINSVEDMKHNWERIRSTLKDYGLSQPSDLFDQEPSSREMLVYLLYLFQVLPYFIPRSTLEFPVMLKGTCVRNIMLSNPSKKKICYSVKLDSINDDYSIEKNIVDLDPGVNVAFPVKYFARISKVNKARITFRNKKESGAQATPLVFDLVSEVQGRHNEHVIKLEEDVQLYEPIAFNVLVQNPYPQGVNFNIKVENVPVIFEELKKKRVGKGKLQDERVYLPAFFCKLDSIPTIPKGGHYNLQMQYVPVTLEQHKCHVIFTDERVGEMQYEIQAEPKMPAPISDTRANKFEKRLDRLEPIGLPISRHNQKMEHAFGKLKDRIRESKSINNAERQDLFKKIDSLKDNLTFFLECDQPYVQVPLTFALNQNRRTLENLDQTRTDPNNSLSEIDRNVLPINLLYKFPVKNQTAKILMRNSTRTDVRIYELDITVAPKKVKALLEMTSPARIPITQIIPLINTLESDVNVKVMITKIKNSEAFKLNVTENSYFKVTRVPYQLILTFDPEWTYESQASMNVFYKETNEEFEYDLRGKGEEPLAEKEYIIECKLKEEKIVEIELDTVKKTGASYQVEIDLPHYASGPPTLEVPYGKVGKYPLKINALLGGEFTGSVTFKNDQGQYWWYMVTLKVESSKFERQLDIVSHCRKPWVQKIELENPINEVVVFKVAIENEYLSGLPQITLQPRDIEPKKVYELTFLPLREFKEKTSVTFMNQKIGDIIYEINLEGEIPPQIKLNPVRCEVGKTERTPITLHNVIKEPARVTARPLLSQNFFLETEQFVIPPMGSYTVDLLYTPTDLEKLETVHILFESREIGSWSYKATGVGVPPTRFDPTDITGTLNKQTSKSILFKNPFREKISVSVSLDANGKNKDVFELVMKKNKEIIGPLQSLDLNFNFMPQEITEYEAEIAVQMNEKVVWRFPIRAVTESVNTSSDIRFVTQCHQRQDLGLQLKLPGVTDIKEDEQFTIKVAINNREINPILHKWIELVPIQNKIRHPDEKLKFEVRFLPHKPFKSFGEIIVEKPNSGRWR
jgi:hypothetical protein